MTGNTLYEALHLFFALYTPIACVGKHGRVCFFAYDLFAVFSVTMLWQLRVCDALCNAAVFPQ